jgi:hypothetical protein
MAFGILFDVSHRGLLFCFVVPPLPKFQSQFVIFDLTLMKFFKRFLGPSSLEWPEAPLICQ